MVYVYIYGPQELKAGFKKNSEAQWLIGDSWNRGVYLFRKQNYKQAERYTARSLALYETLVHISSTSLSYMYVYVCIYVI